MELEMRLGSSPLTSVMDALTEIALNQRCPSPLLSSLLRRAPHCRARHINQSRIVESLKSNADCDGNVLGAVVGGRIAASAGGIVGARLVVDPHVPAFKEQFCTARIRKLVSEAGAEVHSPRVV